MVRPAGCADAGTEVTALRRDRGTPCFAWALGLYRDYRGGPSRLASGAYWATQVLRSALWPHSPLGWGNAEQRL